MSPGTPSAESAPTTPLSDSGTRQRLATALGADYELGELLGSGGFADVWVAWDRTLKREVAVKTIRADLATTAGVVERFRREAEAIARLRHPHVIPIYSVGESDGAAWFVMPRIRGESLASALGREERWPFAEIVRVIREAAGALAEAHRNGLVHRDVKPENIMLDGPERRVVVMDFGIAKSMDEAASGLTGTGMLVGTPYYMSPEQAVGDRNVDHLSDQYSLAVVAYRMLTGRLPFEADSLRSVLFQQAAVTVTPVRELRPDVPVALSRVIERALEKDPQLRYRSMDAFSEALGRVAAEVAGEFRVGRRTPPMSERWAAARLQASVHPRAYLLAAVAGLVAYWLVFPFAEQVLVRRFTGTREEATFTARAWIKSQGAPGDLALRRNLWGWPQRYEFLQRAIPAQADERATTDVHAWWWHFEWFEHATGTTRQIDVGPGNRVWGTWSWLADSAYAPDLGPDSSSAIALRALASRGWTTGLEPVRAGQYASARRTEYSFTYQVPERQVVLGRDTARFEVYARVAGPDVTMLSESLSLPSSFQAGMSPGLRRMLGSAGLLMLMILFLVALGMALRRLQTDTLQWRMGFVLAVAMEILVLAAFILPSLPNEMVIVEAGQSRLDLGVSYVMRSFPAQTTCIAAFIWMVAAESLLYEKRPDIAAGLADVARGRLMIPELVPAALSGYAFGAVLLVAGYMAMALLRVTGITTYPGWPNLSRAFEVPFPVISVLDRLWPALLFAAAGWFLVGWALAIRKPWALPIACAVLGATYAGYRLEGSDATGLRVAVEGVLLCASGWFLYRQGVLATIIALFVLFAMPVATDLIVSGGDPFVWSGVLGVVLIFTPAALALVTWRRHPSRRVVST